MRDPRPRGAEIWLYRRRRRVIYLNPCTVPCPGDPDLPERLDKGLWVPRLARDVECQARQVRRCFEAAGAPARADGEGEEFLELVVL